MTVFDDSQEGVAMLSHKFLKDSIVGNEQIDLGYGFKYLGAAAAGFSDVQFLLQAEKLAVSEPGKYPAFHHLDAGFHFGLVFGLTNPGGKNDPAVMVGHFWIGEANLLSV